MGTICDMEVYYSEYFRVSQEEYYMKNYNERDVCGKFQQKRNK